MTNKDLFELLCRELHETQMGKTTGLLFQHLNLVREIALLNNGSRDWGFWISPADLTKFRMQSGKPSGLTSGAALSLPPSGAGNSTTDSDMQYWQSMYGIGEQPAPLVCECGAEKTYGIEGATYAHSDWCKKYKKP